MPRRAAALLTVLALAAAVAACSRSRETPAEKPAVPGQAILFEGTGPHTRAITTTSAEAQKYFDQGLNFYYGFNHDEAIRSFRQAAALDPRGAMPHWGIALANGPHINNPGVDAAHARAAWIAWNDAVGRSEEASEVERALIDAVGKRYADPQPADRKPLDEAYAAAMREVWKTYPEDADVGALFAEALMDLRPWDLWTQDGKPQPGTDEVLSTLETILVLAPRHPMANHLYIHAVEASLHPEKALPAADVLRTLMPSLSHMVHMPSHIDVRTGRWVEAQEANERAIAADRAYRARVPELGFYHVYIAHNGHMLTYAAMMQGESALAIRTIREHVEGVPPDWAREYAPVADGFFAAPLEVMMRFGEWDSLLAVPDLPSYFPLARTMRRYARGVAYAAQGRLPEAEAEQRAFLAARDSIPEDAIFFNNRALDLLGVAEQLMRGEILLAAGKTDPGLEALREAVRREDALRYNEPPDWIQPVRHALGAALLQAGRAAEAEAVYREDLAKVPENGWSLFGLGRSLRLQGKDAEAAGVEARFQKVWARADVKLSSSCFCQPGV